MNKKYLSLLISIVFFFAILVNSTAKAQELSLQGEALNQAIKADDFAAKAKLSGPSIETIIADIINIVLGLLTVILLINIIYSGFQWMTSGGNEDAIKKAKGRIKNSVIGMLIVLASYIITSFVYNSITKVDPYYEDQLFNDIHF